jgi:hypothetical protein
MGILFDLRNKHGGKMGYHGMFPGTSLLISHVAAWKILEVFIDQWRFSESLGNSSYGWRILEGIPCR